MTKIFSIFFGLVIIAGCATAQRPSESTYHVTGNIKGLNKDSVFVITYDEELGKSDTLAIRSVDDRFELKGKTVKSTFAHLLLGNLRSRTPIYFYLEPGRIHIAGHTDSLSYIRATGTKTNNDYAGAQEYLVPIYERRSALIQRIRTLTEDAPEYQTISRQLKSIADSVNGYKMTFIKENPNSDISLGYLYVLQDNMSLADAEALYTNLSPHLKESNQGKYIGEKLQANKTVDIGNKAPDFTSSDTSGVAVRLSDFKGKYVLLEFWAHWCVPCRAQHPHLKEVYSKFKDKGFTILQYSLDQKKDEKKWKEAIIKDSLVWPQICDLTDAKAPVAELYGVQPIPDSFLISPDGTILGRKLKPKELEETLAKLLQ